MQLKIGFRKLLALAADNGCNIHGGIRAPKGEVDGGMKTGSDILLSPTMTSQLGALAVATLVVAGLALGLWWWQGRGRSAVTTTSARHGGRRVGPALVGGATLGLLLFLVASGLRQVWPHPGLQMRALAALAGLTALSLMGWWARERQP